MYGGKMKIIDLLVLISLFALSSCTYSINMVHTQGTADDVVDETQRAAADIRPNITLPALP